MMRSVRNVGALTFITCFVAVVFAGVLKAEIKVPLPPGSAQIDQISKPPARWDIPVGPWVLGEMARKSMAGHVTATLFKAPNSAETLEVAEAIKTALESDGFETFYTCSAQGCGGFNFRFGIGLPEPEAMQVDLRDFQYIALGKAGDEGEEPSAVMTILISRLVESTLILISDISKSQTSNNLVSDPVKVTPATSPTAPVSQSGVIVLEGLKFATGKAGLSADPELAIASLARFLREHPGVNIILVGHSDMSGSLKGNLGLSRQRADTVAKVLVRDHGISKPRLQVEGVGYLAPRWTNETTEGRTNNRRIEAVLVPQGQ